MEAEVILLLFIMIFNWAYNQGKVYDLWAAAGSQWDDGIAVLDGRYLIACTKKVW